MKGVSRGRRADLVSAPRPRQASPPPRDLAAPLARLRRRPRTRERVVEPRADAADRQTLLCQRIAVPHRHRLVVQRLLVDREGERRADLVLRPVAPADRPAVVVLHAGAAAQLLVQGPGSGRHLLALTDQREHRRGHGRHLGMQAQDDALAVGDDLLVVRVDEQRDEDPLDAHGRLDHVRHVPLAVGPYVLELRGRELGVLRQVIVAPVRNALELGPTDRIQVLDVTRRLRVVRPLLGPVLPHTEAAIAQAVAPIPGQALVDPVAVPAVRLRGRHEVLHLHLLELANAEQEVPRRDLVAERLAGLGDAERRPPARELEHVLEVDEDALRGLGPEEGMRCVVADRPDVRLEHQVELARVREIALLGLARVLARLAAALRILELVGAEPELARPAVHEGVGEAFDVAGGLPDARMEDDRRVERDDVVSLQHHRIEPRVADVVLQQDAVVAIVVRRAEPAVDLRRREDEPTPTAERDDLVHRHHVCAGLGFRHGGTLVACAAIPSAPVSERPTVELHIVSDSTGETAARLVQALEAQFPDQEFYQVRHPRVEAVEDLELAVRSARGRPAVVEYPLVEPEMRDAMRRLCRRARVHYCDLLGHPIDAVARVSGQAARMTPGTRAPLTPAYFRRIEAIEFSVKYDDGLGAGLDEADFVLVGVSRTSKTPLSIYLGYLGHKVANIPVVKGIKPPGELFEIDPRKVVGLTIDAERLADIRGQRVRAMGSPNRR